LWEYDDNVPSIDGGPGFMDIRLDSNFPIIDIDGDGVPELVCARRYEGNLALCIVNARDGLLKRHVPFPGMAHRPGDCRGSIIIANLSGNETPSDIIVSWDYAYISAFNNKLESLWVQIIEHAEGRKHNTMGHTPYAGDIDNDGRDEIIAGSCLLNADGSLRWVAPDYPALLKDGHADSVQIVSLDEKTQPNIVMSTGAYCFSADGKLLWGRDQLKHGQAQHVGKIRDDIDGKQVVIYEGSSRVIEGIPDNVLALTSDGELLWDYEVQQPDMQEGGFGFWLGDWDGDGLDEVFINDQEKVDILDGFGRVMETLPGHLIYVFDLVGDARAEAVVLTGIEPGMQMQVWTNDSHNPNPLTNKNIYRRITTKTMYNCTRY
jgi:hypothetical protein